MVSFGAVVSLICVCCGLCTAASTANTTETAIITTQRNNAAYINHVTNQPKDAKKFNQGAMATTRQGSGVVRSIMSTATGMLAAVGGGFLLYNGLLAILGEDPLSRFPIFEQLESQRRYPYGVPPYAYYTGYSVDSANVQRRSDVGKPSKSLRQLMKALGEVDFPERMFQWLRVYDDSCKQRTVCEFEQFLTTKGIAGLVLNFLSPQIPGMHKYTGAISRGLRNENCGVAYRGCPESLGQRLLKLIGLR
ncbi:uncharacterized protein LOC135366098 [Ornithodoros turicata]